MTIRKNVQHIALARNFKKDSIMSNVYEFHYKDCVGKVKWETILADSEPLAHETFNKKHVHELVTVLEVFLDPSDLDLDVL
jgi:hypothetical protein